MRDPSRPQTEPGALTLRLGGPPRAAHFTAGLSTNKGLLGDIIRLPSATTTRWRRQSPSLGPAPAALRTPQPPARHPAEQPEHIRHAGARLRTPISASNIPRRRPSGRCAVTSMAAPGAGRQRMEGRSGPNQRCRGYSGDRHEGPLPEYGCCRGISCFSQLTGAFRPVAGMEMQHRQHNPLRS